MAVDEEMYLSSMTPKSGDIITIHRQLYTQTELEERYRTEPESKSVCEAIRNSCSISPMCVGRHALGYLPIVRVLRRYKWRQFLVADSLGGLSAAFIHLPQGLGYGILASLKPIQGLYTSFFPVLVYMLFGTSPHVSMGTNAVIAILTADLLDRSALSYVASLGPNSTVTDDEILDYKIGITTASCFVCGLILLGMGILKLGFLTNYLSKSFIGGFTFAAAVHIATSQIVKMLHVKIPPTSGAGKLVMTYVNIFSNITTSVPGDIIVGVICMALLLVVKVGINEKFKDRLKIPIPIELLCVIGSTIISHFTKLHDNFGIAIVGDVPTGMPFPSFPPLEALSKVATESFVMAILAFALTIALAKICAQIHTYDIDDNQELVAYGLCNIVGTFFQNFPSSAAPPRTMLLSSMGAKSTLNGLTSSVFILLVLLVIGKLFESLPIAMLAAMIIVAMKDLLMQIRTLPTLWRVNKPDFFIWVLTALVSILADLDLGLMAGVGFSLLTVLMVSQLATGTLLGKSEFEDVIMATDRKGVRPVPGVCIFKFESQLYFASVDRFKKQLFALVYDPARFLRKRPKVKVISEGIITVQAVAASMFAKEMLNEKGDGTLSAEINEGYKTSEEAEDRTQAGNANGSFPKEWSIKNSSNANDIHHLLLDCSAMTYIDTAGVDALQVISSLFRKSGTEVLLVGMPPVSLKTLRKSGFLKTFGEDRLFYSLFDALCAVNQKDNYMSKL